ncbi:hypothetical protein SAMN04488052_102513 [Aquisalimonas asiatica]|uniref:Uncharacterized protein n=1 Tax=Aquisalimonas asiatica TaxID=406100 RepID=A0A1H8S5K6_9GAMM|nr:hypothetical protein SAMN04488052_102513 [Aquisalimonas asiatica]
MQTQQPNGTLEGGVPARCSWLLLVLLILLPVTVALASPAPAQALSGQYASDVHPHGPSDTPVCHHHGHHGNASALVSDIRDLELPTPGDGFTAVAAQCPAQPHPTLHGLPGTATADTHRPPLPTYLRTRRLRL